MSINNVLVAAALLLSSATAFGGFADSVLSYNPGIGATPGYDNTSSVLGEPSRITPGEFGGPVDPFSAPFLSEQVLSLGAGGSLTVQLQSPAFDSPFHPFGLDFTIFGNAGFIITNGDFSGGGITDGSLYGGNTGETRVWASEDNITYYELSPSLSPLIDRYFPTDGSGDFTIPVNPALTPESFSGKDLSGIRELYAGSGGGASFDLAWARDSQGNSVNLTSARFLRIDVLSGTAEIDGFSVVPEPTSLAIFGLAGLLLVGRFTRKQK